MKHVFEKLGEFIKRMLGKLFDVADRYSDEVVTAVEWLQSHIENNEEKLRQLTDKTKSKLDDKALELALSKLPEVLKGIKEVDGILDGSETDEEVLDKVREKVKLESKTDKRRFYTDVAAGLLMAVVSKKIPDWLAVVLTQWAFGRLFKA